MTPYWPENTLRFNLRVSYFQNFPGGACPQTPLEGLCFTLRDSVHSELLHGHAIL